MHAPKRALEAWLEDVPRDAPLREITDGLARFDDICLVTENGVGAGEREPGPPRAGDRVMVQLHGDAGGLYDADGGSYVGVVERVHAAPDAGKGTGTGMGKGKGGLPVDPAKAVAKKDLATAAVAAASAAAVAATTSGDKADAATAEKAFLAAKVAVTAAEAAAAAAEETQGGYGPEASYDVSALTSYEASGRLVRVRRRRTWDLDYWGEKKAKWSRSQQRDYGIKTYE